MTQALFDLALPGMFLARFGGRSPVPLLVGVWPLRSHALAVRLHNEVPGIVVPERGARGATTGGSAGGRRWGSSWRGGCSRRSREKSAGIYVIPPFKQPEAALDLLG